MKESIKYLAILFIVLFTIWGISTSIPRIIDIYKNKPVIEKVDTVYYSDTVYFERTVADTLPKYRYETIIKHDTLYKLEKGDSIEKIPRVITLKKKATLKRYPLGVIR